LQSYCGWQATEKPEIILALAKVGGQQKNQLLMGE
jgi:hypothetical protein